MIPLPDARSVVQETYVIDVRSLAYVLATVDVARVKGSPELIQKLTWLKEEARDVLYQHFMPQMAEMDPTMESFIRAQDSFETQRASFQAMQRGIFGIQQSCSSTVSTKGGCQSMS